MNELMTALKAKFPTFRFYESHDDGECKYRIGFVEDNGVHGDFDFWLGEDENGAFLGDDWLNEDKTRGVESIVHAVEELMAALERMDN